MTTVKVFHARLTEDGHMYNPNMDGRWPFDETHYVLAATVEIPAEVTDSQAREIAFERTNHIDRSWWSNHGVTCHVAGRWARSTSVGDIVQIEDRVYRVLNVGWEVVS